MTVDSANTDLQDLENYLKNAKNKGCNESDLNIILNVLQCPVFKNIVTVQNSLKELQKQCAKHPTIDSKNFNITTDGRLELIDVPDDTQDDALNESAKSNLSEEDERRFWEYIERAAKGREVVKVNLFKSDNECLGFNVVGLRAEQIENLGIFVENIAKNGIADREGSLQVGDQILAINKEMLDSDICHKKAIEILQTARGSIELIVAKSKSDSENNRQTTSDYSINADDLVTNVPIERSLNDLNLSSSNINRVHKSENNLELSQYLQNEPGLEKFSQVELIELVNTGKGLGFGILGGKSTGVVIKTILAGGVSDKDGRLKSGDHILQINNVPLRGMSSEQVAQVLRSAGTNVKLLVARQKANLDSLEQPTAFSSLSTTEANVGLARDYQSIENESFEVEKPKEEVEEQPERRTQQINEVSIINQINEEENEEDDELEEVKSIEVELVKDKKGLGITIAGYVCEKEDISGIYVKSIAPDSAADLSGKIQLNDQIIEVDGISLLEFTNHEAVEVLRKTGKVVNLKLARFLKGTRFDRLQLAINNANFDNVKPIVAAKPNQTILQVNSEQQQQRSAHDTVDKTENTLMDLDKIKDYWLDQLGDDYEIVIATFEKFTETGGLGISLELYLIEQEGSKEEPKPHHYIESILPQGPVGLNGILKPGDEILQVNQSVILNMEHTQVVRLLKELPINVCMICARPKNIEKSIINLRTDDNSGDNLPCDQAAILEQYISTSNNQERLVKAKSDGSLQVVNSSLEILSKIKSRSLEPLTGQLAMWNSNPVLIELTKGDRGLGFSVLDYQDPLNPSETVIVIRSLVQGGIAQQTDGNLMPGDRLLAVNDISLENATLDLAVQVLKGAPKGTVRLLVAKPLPICEQQCNYATNQTDFSTKLVTNSSLNKNLDLPVTLLQPEIGEIEQQSEQDSEWKSVDIDDFEKADYLLKQRHLGNLEKSFFNRDDSILINRSRSYSPLSMQNEYEPLAFVDDFGYTELPIPSELEQLIVLQKRNQSLGVTLELSEQGINGLIVRALSKKGLIFKDGRIQIGDNLLAINHESLRNTTTSKAKAIFKRVNLVEGEIPLKYVPECEAQCYRRNASFEKSKSQRSLPTYKQYCRTPSPTQKNSSFNPFS